MNVTVIGCGRWGSLIAWYLDKIGHSVTLYGRSTSTHMQEFIAVRRNELLTLPQSIMLSTELSCVTDAEVVIISINAQGLQSLMDELSAYRIHGKTFVLCMKGIEVKTGRRLSEVAADNLPEDNDIAVWLGPGHAEEFYRGVPNCMVIDSDSKEAKERLVDAFSSDLIRFYFGQDLIGNEIGAAAKNVVGIAAGMLDGLNLTSLKGALMSRGTREISRLISAMGGNELSTYGLCHLGDYEATLFSPHSHNRRFGENFAKGEPYTKLAEGCETVRALVNLGHKYNVDLPICEAVNAILHEGKSGEQALLELLGRRLKKEF